jgi:DNA repair photolyase
VKPKTAWLFPELAGAPSLRDVADAVREAGLEGLPGASRLADQARYVEVHVKSALTRAMGMSFGWALNPYRGCTHACEYCYARKYQRHLELGAGDDFSSVILVKTNIADVLRRELARPTWAREGVAVGTATDPYQPIEGHYRLTRRILEALMAARTPCAIITKGPMIVRDIDILASAPHEAPAEVCFSIPTVDERAWAALEPGTAPPSQRLRAARTLADAGIRVRVLMMPLVPGLSTSRSSIERTVQAIAEAGLPLAGANVARLDPGVREHFFGFLERTFPELLEGYRRLYPGANAKRDYTDAVKASVEAARRQVGDAGRRAGADGGR